MDRHNPWYFPAIFLVLIRSCITAPLSLNLLATPRHHHKMFATFIMGVVNTLFSIICFWVVDRVGRRKLLLTGSAVAAICLVTIATILPHINNYPSLRLIAVLCLITYIAGYCISVGSLFWLIIAEIFPLHVRGVGMSLAAAVQWGANLLVSMTFLSLIHFFGASQVFLIYGLVCVACFIFVIIKSLKHVA